MSLKQISELLENLRDDEYFKNMNCDLLSSVEVRIAILMTTLAEEVAESRRQANDADAIRKFNYSRVWKEVKEGYIKAGTKYTIADIDHETVVRLKDALLKVNEVEEKADKLDKVWEALEKVINALKDRLKVLMKEEGYTPSREVTT